MVTFAFELYVARERAACLDELAARVQAAAEELRKAGTAVRYLRSIYLPEDETCFVLAEASSQPAAVQLSKRAALDSVRIVEAALPTSRRREGADQRQGFAKVSARTAAEYRRMTFGEDLTTSELEGEGRL